MKNLLMILLFVVGFTKCVDHTTPPRKKSDAEKVGVNAFTWTPLGKLDTFKAVRLYISTGFICTAKGLFVEPIFQSRSDVGAGLDSYLEEAKKRGIHVVLCINQSPTWMQTGESATALTEDESRNTTYQRNPQATELGLHPDAPPVKEGANRLDPAAYSNFASVFAQLAKRYGRIHYNDSQLKVDTSQRWTNDGPNKKKSGLGYPISLEIWNEPDKWWYKGSPVYFTPAEYATMLSVCYDSIKAADPSINVVMGGLTDFDLEYLESMDFAFRSIRATNPKKWPCDVINLHHYSNVGNKEGVHPPTWVNNGGCPPEQDKNFSSLNKCLKFARDRSLLFWVSEFGYDTRLPSLMAPVQPVGKSLEEAQAMYLKASLQAYIAAGVDQCFVFTANNEPGALNGGLWLNCGLLHGEGEPGQKWIAKPAYDTILQYLSTL